MSALIFVTFWVLVAIGLTFVALSGGAKGARERLHGQSKTGRTLSIVFFGLALLAFGIAIPAAVVAAVTEREAIPESNVTALNAKEQRGRQLFGQHCILCHTLKAANANAKVGPNLDNLRPPKALVLDAIDKGRARGQGAMAADLVEGPDAEAVAAFVEKAVGSGKKK
jgi:mono/diheme cytochrome c family protein